jgi:hypothetical protein
MIAGALIASFAVSSANAGLMLESDMHDEFLIRYEFKIGEDRKERSCNDNWLKIGTTAILHSLTNSFIRGSTEIGGSLPTGATLSGHAIAWIGTALLYDLDIKTTGSLILSDVVSEQITGWGEELDIGLVAGDPNEETARFAQHLYRARIGSMTIIDNEAGWSSEMLKAAPAVGAMGYRYGAELKKDGKLPDTGQMKQHYRTGELIHGMAYGLGVARTLDCKG